MHALDLAVDQVTGAIEGRGPGTVTHVARGMNRARRSPHCGHAASLPCPSVKRPAIN